MLSVSLCLATVFGLVWLVQTIDDPLGGTAELAAGFLGRMLAAGLVAVLLACLAAV